MDAAASGTLKHGLTTLGNGSTFTGSPQDVTYKPDADFNGADAFKFKVTDTGDPAGCSSSPCSAALSSAVQTVDITVNPVDDALASSASPANVTGANSIDEDAAATTVSLSGADV